MTKKSNKPARHRRINPALASAALQRRILQRVATTGTLILPAVPSLVEQYVKTAAAAFRASGRGLFEDELGQLKRVTAHELEAAFAGSPRSKIEIRFEAEAARPLGYLVEQHVRTIPDAYERWIGSSDGPLFGAHADARVLSLASAMTEPERCPILDFGAGTGRNALPLGRRGHPVDAIEITPKFAEILAQAATDEQLPVRVVVRDVFRDRSGLRRDYRLVIASEVAPDFRGVAELRQLFELAADVLVDGGLLLFNVHLTAQGYNPDKAARELGQQCYSCPFTLSEIAEAGRGLPFTLCANDSVHDFEKAHLPPEAWPPTTWYENWTLGLDVYATEPEQCPLELRWLVFEKGSGERTAASDPTSASGSSSLASRPRRFDPVVLKQALTRRLMRRLNASGTLILPAVPALRDLYVALCCQLFDALGRKLDTPQRDTIQSQLQTVLEDAFAQSQRSNVAVTYEAPSGKELHYTFSADPVTLGDAYAEWYGNLGDQIFGTEPDARLRSLLDGLGDPRACPVLDIGAGTGRNALFLAQRGHVVDAVEPVPVFAALLVDAGAQWPSLRVVQQDIFHVTEALRGDYQLVLISGTVGDFRSFSELRATVELASRHLAPGGRLLMSVHLTVDDSPADAVMREWGQQCSAMSFCRAELTQACDGLSLTLIADESAYDYERTHLPEAAWPPSPAFPEWALGLHMYALDREQCPIELRWLLYEKR